MIIFLYRPSPQVPKPSSRAALKCFDGASYIINLSSQQVKKAAVDITWIFLLTLYMALNTLLWALSYPEVRAVHPREELEELVNVALDIIDQCSERWPGSASASQLYGVFAKACMQSYDAKEQPQAPSINSALTTPPSMPDTNSPSASETSAPTSVSTSSHNPQAPQQASFSPPQFGYVFDATPEQMSTNYANYSLDESFQPNQPTFRSNSIFLNPGSNGSERRGSYFAPDFTHSNEATLAEQLEEATPPATTTPQLSQGSPPLLHNSHHSPAVSTTGPSLLPTPPESLAPQSTDFTNLSLSPTLTLSSGKAEALTPTVPHASPAIAGVQGSPLPPAPLSQLNLKFGQGMSKVPAVMKQEPTGPGGRTPTFTIPPLPQQNAQQRPLPGPTTVTDWFSPPPPFISPYAAFSGIAGANNYWVDMPRPPNYAGLGVSNGGVDGYPVDARGRPDGPHAFVGADDGTFGGMFGGNGLPQYAFPPERQGSLSQEQQMELMDVLENEGVQDIDAFLNMGMGLGGGGIDGGVRWQ